MSDNIKSVIVGIVYRPPAASSQLFSDRLVHFIECVRREYDCDFIMCRDSNHDFLSYDDNNDTQMFMNSMAALALVPLISKPTRVTDNSATLIDNIFLLNPLNFKAGTIVSDVSDHFPIFLIIESMFCSHIGDCGRTATYRIANKQNLRSFSERVSGLDLDVLMGGCDASEAPVRLNNILMHHYDCCCPIKTKTVSYKDAIKPWITNEIKSFMRIRQSYYALYRSQRMRRSVYNQYRNFVNGKIRKSKINYFEGKFDLYKSNIRGTWKIINDIIRPRAASDGRSVRELIVNGSVVSDDAGIAGEFNKFFSTVGSSIAQSLDQPSMDFKSFLPDECPVTFNFSPVSAPEVSRIISSLKNKSADINSLPAGALKSVSGVVSPVVAEMVNLSFRSGSFPDSEKIARVVPIYKDGSQADVSNYRPISILPLFSKVYEKVVYRQLYEYLISNNILTCKQFGFRSGVSTSNALVSLTRYIYDELDSNKYVFSIFIDFRKAFDCVDHQLLLSKLQHYGVKNEELSFFKSYLTNRRQFVRMGDSVSSEKNASGFYIGTTCVFGFYKRHNIYVFHF